MIWNKPKLIWLPLISLFVAAFAFRFYTLGMSRMIAERQFRSALIARAYYFEATDSVPEWRKQIAEINKQRMDIVEPPIMEFLVASIYRIADKEYLRIAGLVSSLFWIIGGIFLYKITTRIASREGAMFATAYYLFVPLGVVLSISFLPEPLMIMTFVFSLLTIIRYYERPSTTGVVIAGIVSGLAILIKPFALFAILGAFLSLKIYNKASWKRMLDLDLFIFLGLFMLPVVLYYLYGILVADYLADNAQGSLLPQLLLTRDYWRRWLLTATGSVGLTPLAAAVLGMSVLQKAWSRALLIGLWIGYAVFCLVFTYHIRFADYYHSQLIIIVALAIGPIIDLVIVRLKQLSYKRYWRLPVVGALLLILLFNLRGVKDKLASSRPFESKEVAQEIGELINHSSRTVYISPYYGTPLEYYAELSGVFWPRSVSDQDRVLGRQGIRSVEQRLNDLGFIPEYFVVTDFNDFNQHHADLREFLSKRCTQVAQDDEYLIYRACEK